VKNKVLKFYYPFALGEVMLHV